MRILFGILFPGVIIALAVCPLIARRSGKPVGKAAAILMACR